MAGVKGMRDKFMNSPSYMASIRDRIKTGIIITKLQKHVNGDVEMKDSQVRAALGLLKKVVPDLSSTTLVGDINLGFAEKLTKALERAGKPSD